MDEIRAFFNNPCPSGSQVVKLRGPMTGGMRITKEDTINQLNRRDDHRRTVALSGTDYVRGVTAKESKIYLKNEMERVKWKSQSRNLESMEQLSVGDSMLNVRQLTEESMTEVYSKYSFQRKEDTNKLPIHQYKQKILDEIRSYPVVIVEGPTGCGKTTQVPQWILDECYQSRKPCKIIVTQPRRIAAISIAKRVAQERGWDVGGLVGYQVGLDNRCTTDTRIHYVTTGVLLQKLVASKTLNEYTHIILDEVHERGQEMDFLLLVVKRLLYTQSSTTTRVVLMSATFDCEAFTDYFKIPEMGMSITIKVAKKDSMFNVKTYYLDQLHKFQSTIIDSTKVKDETNIAPEMFHLVIRLLNAFEYIDKQEDGYDDRDEADLPSVLIFLPGINEIEEQFECLTDKALRRTVAGDECAKYEWWVLPLHSTITADEQVRVFQRAPPGRRKIILATNIAESSITVPDIKYVIDFCLVKILVADEQTNFTSLQLKWASKTNCEQRAGRAGRVRDGRVYRLVSRTFYENLSQDCDPEIRRCPLDRLVLLSKMLDMGPPSYVLALAMNPPDLSNIHRTVLCLKEIGALKKTVNGEEDWCSSDGDITYLGRIMAKLPLDVKISKLIMLGYIYGCLEETVIMAGAMSVKNLFSSPFRERLNAYNSKLTWADGSMSDCIAFLNVYKVWSHLKKQQFFKQTSNNELQWARRFYVQVRSLRELDELVRELRSRLSREGIDALKGSSPWDRNETPLVLKVLIAGAFYPQYFVQVSQDEEREREACRTLAGFNPRNTVYLQNFPDDQPGELYAATIKKLIRQQIGDEPRVTFDKNSRKVFLTFADSQGSRNDNNSGDPTIPGQVLLPVYKAIKARQLKMDIRIPLLPLQKALDLHEAMTANAMQREIDQMVPRLPEVDDTYFPLKLSHMISVGKFWVQYDDESTASEVEKIHETLNTSKLLAYTDDVRAGDLIVAPYVDSTGTSLHRGKILRILPRDMVEVLYIDYGSYGRVNKCNLYQLRAGVCSETPPLAMQCVLAEIAPSPVLNQHAQWTNGAINYFQKLINRGRLLGKVYSVSHGVVSIELLAEGGKININTELLQKGYAIPCEESYDSKLNHDLRQSAADLNMTQKRAYNKEQAELAFSQLREVEPPNAKDCILSAVLKGPTSPLETTLHNLMYGSREKTVQIEWNSVNSVLLDTDPQEVYERLIVAADVGQNAHNKKLTLRHTTLMPNIPGLPALIALLFCPQAELRRDTAGSRYVSVLCGLGSSDCGAPHFPEHDLLVNIDADITISDIGLINHIRHLMDYMMRCGEGQDTPNIDDDFRAQVPAAIRKDLMSILLARRKHHESQTVVGAWEWKSVPEHELLEISEPDMVQRAVVFPLHAPLELQPMSRETLLELKRENDNLKMLVSRSSLSANAELACKLCGTPPMPTHAMRIHLHSKAHKGKEEDFRVFQS